MAETCGKWLPRKETRCALAEGHASNCRASRSLKPEQGPKGTERPPMTDEEITAYLRRLGSVLGFDPDEFPELVKRHDERTCAEIREVR